MDKKDKILRNILNISKENQLSAIVQSRKHFIIGIKKLNEICETYNILGLLSYHERETLAQFFGHVRLLCLFDDLRERHKINDFYNIGMFANVHSLEFVKIDINSIRSFHLIQPGLKCLTFDKCSPNLSIYIKQYSWTFLEELNISHSNDLNLTSSIKFLHNLKRLKLVFCSLTLIGDHLHNLTKLENLNLSFNKLETLPNTNAPLSVLILRGNAITSLTGIGELDRLTHLDVSLNNIDHPKSIEEVSLLRNLKNFDFSENPISFVRNIRHIVLKCVFWCAYHPNLLNTEFILNGKGMSRKDKLSVNTCDYQLHRQHTKKTITLNLATDFCRTSEIVVPEPVLSDDLLLEEDHGVDSKNPSDCSVVSPSHSLKSFSKVPIETENESEDCFVDAESANIIESASSFKVFERTGTLGRTSKELILSFNNFESLSLVDKIASYEIKIPFRDVTVEKDYHRETVIIKNIEDANKSHVAEAIDVIQLSFEGIGEIKRFDYLNKICSGLRNFNEEILQQPSISAVNDLQSPYFLNYPHLNPESSIEVVDYVDEDDSAANAAFLSKMWGDGSAVVIGDPDVVNHVGSLLTKNDCANIFISMGTSNRIGNNTMTYLCSTIFQTGECFVCAIQCPLLEFDTGGLLNGVVVLSDRRLLIFERFQRNSQLKMLENYSVEHIGKVVVGFGHGSFYFAPTSSLSKYVVFTGDRAITDDFFGLFKNVLEDSFAKVISPCSMRRQLIKAYLYQTVNLHEITNPSDLIGAYQLWTSRRRLSYISFLNVFMTDKYIALLNESLPFRPEGGQLVPFTSLSLHSKINMGLISSITVYPHVHDLLITVEFSRPQLVLKKKEKLHLLFVSNDDLSVFLDYLDKARVSQAKIKRVEQSFFFNLH